LTLVSHTISQGIYRYYGKIQDKDDEYYLQFNLVICGLDSVEARRWINATLVNLVDSENPESLKPLIDGGTEGVRAPLTAGPTSLAVTRF
jgi:molybdopterin/thiamine biosynthesis adenylyltransferase